MNSSSLEQQVLDYISKLKRRLKRTAWVVVILGILAALAAVFTAMLAGVLFGSFVAIKNYALSVGENIITANC